MSDYFDLRALQTALNARRMALGLAWEDVGAELGVSAATLRALGTRQTAEGDGVLRVLAWLKRSAESFTNYAAGAGADAWRPPAAAGTLRFNTRALYTALDTERLARGLTWRDVAAASGAGSAGAITRLRSGGRVMFPAVMRMLAWLGMPAAQFVRVDSRAQSRP